MKLARYVHHLNNFHLLKTEGVNQRAAEGASKNPPKIGYFRKNRKNRNKGVGEFEDMEFPGVVKK